MTIAHINALRVFRNGYRSRSLDNLYHQNARNPAFQHTCAGTLLTAFYNVVEIIINGKSSLDLVSIAHINAAVIRHGASSQTLMRIYHEIARILPFNESRGLPLLYRPIFRAGTRIAFYNVVDWIINGKSSLELITFAHINATVNRDRTSSQTLESIYHEIARILTFVIDKKQILVKFSEKIVAKLHGKQKKFF